MINLATDFFVLPAMLQHRHVPLSRTLDQQNRSKEMEKYFPDLVRTIPEHRPVSKHEAQQLVADALRAAFGKHGKAYSRIAGIAGVDRKTAESWYHGRSSPGIEHLFNLMREVPELAAEVRRLTAMQADLDPRFAQAFDQAMTLFTAMRSR